MHFTREDIDKLSHFYKINFVNSLSGYKPANLIATRSPHGISNVAVFSSVVHYGSSPPILGFVLRPTTVPRNTYKNIKDTGVFTINHISHSMIEDAHHTSAKYPFNVSEFSKTKLEEEYINNIFSPFVKQAPVKIAMKFLEEYFIKANDTILVLGEVTDVFVNDDMLAEDGFLDLTKSEIASIIGLDGYAVSNSKKRLGYQRPILK